MHGVANNWSDFWGWFVIGQEDTPQEHKIWVDLQISWN